MVIFYLIVTISLNGTRQITSSYPRKYNYLTFMLIALVFNFKIRYNFYKLVAIFIYYKHK